VVYSYSEDIFNNTLKQVFVGAEIYYFNMTREDLQELMLKQVDTKINNSTRGTTKRRI
jgi:hypothetical protein